MNILISEEVKAAFPGLRLAHLDIKGMQIGAMGEKVTELLKEVSERTRASLTLENVKDRADFRAYRDFFWKLGVDPTKTRPASEALVRRVLKGSSIPRINDFVDSYNIASIETGVPIAAFDMDALDEDITLRFSGEGEEFLGIGMEGRRVVDPHILVMSSRDELVAVYPYRDADASRITTDTHDAVLISCGVPSIGSDVLLQAAGKARDNVILSCGGHPSKVGSA
jgi:DNA/RNA-binding domain of Phe-tRNA-synthetase-like protein